MRKSGCAETWLERGHERACRRSLQRTSRANAARCASFIAAGRTAAALALEYGALRRDRQIYRLAHQQQCVPISHHRRRAVIRRVVENHRPHTAEAAFQMGQMPRRRRRPPVALPRCLCTHCSCLVLSSTTQSQNTRFTVRPNSERRSLTCIICAGSRGCGCAPPSLLPVLRTCEQERRWA